MTLLGYARVSREDQEPDLQIRALREAGCERIWVEHASGARRDRPELTKVLGYIRPGDTLVVWHLDRLGRSVKHLIELIDYLHTAGAQFRSLTEAIDTTTATGGLFFHINAAFAEFERRINSERTIAGLASARARGRPRGGRRLALTPTGVASARQMMASGTYTVSQIAASLHVGRSTIYRALEPGPGDAGYHSGPSEAA